MGFRFRKSFKVLPGVRLNLSKKGFSTSIGGRGGSVNLSARGVRSTVGIPGSGLSYSTLHKATPAPQIPTPSSSSSSSSTPRATAALLAGGATAVGTSVFLPGLPGWAHLLALTAVSVLAYRLVRRPAKDLAVIPDPEPLPALEFEQTAEPINQPETQEFYEANFWDAVSPITLSRSFEISYVDRRGNATRRVVDMTAFDPDTDLFIGHCHLRQDRRTFRFDRVRECVDRETGEIVTDLLTHCLDLYRATPEGTLDRVADDNFDTLKVLIFFAKLDSRLTRKERAVIHSFLATLARDDRITAEMTDAVIDDCDVPSLAAFRLAVGRLAKKDSSYREGVLEACRMMAATEKKVSGAESEALQYLEQRFAPKGAQQP